MYDAINSSLKKQATEKTKADKRGRMRKVDTMFIFDPRVHMDLSKEDLDKLDEFEKLDSMDWFIET